MNKRLLFILTLLAISALMLAACAPAAEEPAEEEMAEEEVAEEAPAEEEVAEEAPAEEEVAEEEMAEEGCASEEVLCAGEVTDVGGIDDRSFNETAWKGLENAETELGAQVQYLESQQQTDYERNINEFLGQDYDLIIGVGFLMGDAVAAAAEANPDTNFAIVDFAYDPTIPNVLGLVFATDEAAFLAGYLAAGMTQTGVIGTFGGIEIPTVTAFMDGYMCGAEYYNEQKGTSVTVLGRDLFTGNFESTDDGRRFGETLMDEGADVVMPVAGPVGLGTAAAVQERGAMFIGVDADMYLTAPDFSEVILTSVMKNMDVSVFEATQAVQDGTFEGGLNLSTLSNGGVGLAPFHDFEDDVPDELKAELEDIEAGIIAGDIDVGFCLAE